MSFEGVTENFNRETITGWANYLDHGDRIFPDVGLYVRTPGNFAPSNVIYRVDERTGFVFRSPPELRDIGWPESLDEFESIVATSPDLPEAGKFTIPFFNSVLSSLNPDNRTGRRDDAIRLNSHGRIAVSTIAYNEQMKLPLWTKYYAAPFGAGNPFIIDQASDQCYDEILPKGVTIIRIPRDMFDNRLLARQVAIMQRFLLEAHDWVLYSDSDGFICAAPAALRANSAVAAELRDAPFDPATSHTVVTDWMRTAIAV